jgi:hypothetical protein
MNGTSTDRRGTANRGTGKLPPERNVPEYFYPVVPGKVWKGGFDVGRHNITPVMKEGLDSIAEQFKKSDDVRPTLVIWGHASESTYPGKGPKVYAGERAQAVKDYFVKQHRINPDQVRIEADTRTGTRSASEYTQAEKAAARSATIEIKPSGQKRGTAYKYTDNTTYVKGTPTKGPDPELLTIIGLGALGLPAVGAGAAAGAALLPELLPLGLAGLALYGGYKLLSGSGPKKPPAVPPEGIPDNPRQPYFFSYFDVRIPPHLLGASREAHNRYALGELRSKLYTPSGAIRERAWSEFNDEQRTAIIKAFDAFFKGKNKRAVIPGFRWHHHTQDVGILQLVPFADHRVNHYGWFFYVKDERE